MPFDAFMETAWNDHGDRPQEVADRLSGSLQVIETAEQIPPFARLLTHVFGEHLGQWRQGIALLESLRSLPAFDGSPAVTGALARSVGVLRYASGDSQALEPLSREDRVTVLATVSSALAARGEFTQALSAYSEALRLADTGLPAGSPAIRALAVGGNNLATSLELKNDRDASETAGMIVAAEGGLKYWKQAGTWLEEERAEYRLARSLLQAGKAEAAIQSARRCIEVCSSNDAPAFEQFFGYAVLALAQRAAADVAGFAASREHARRLYELVPAADRQWCESDLAELADASATAT
jgi:tetratricopeptide (TPR) repeat protein